ncbi:MAG TPA: DUF4118 domain-containing protein [Pyrinomonadaceae bacterium]|nr:DUF4118 domain-containing protein [Pyrinomonadaceae bacterium]
MTAISFSGRTGYFIAVISMAAATAALALLRLHINPTTVALILLLVVLFLATMWGSGPALLAAVLGVLSFNFFFLPPYHTFTIADPQNWVALAAFLLIAVTAGQLSARAKRRAEEAEAGRVEIDRLYKELRDAFERASHVEALKHSEKLKSALLDAVTHNIRTPLTSIKASVTTLLDDLGQRISLDNESRRDMLDVINEECDRLNRFVEAMIELARIEAGEMRLRRGWSTVDEIVTTALERAQPLTRRHRVEVQIEKDLMIRVDPSAVVEVIYTLLDNATKYSAPGTTILVRAKRHGEGTIQLSVEDEGSGIPRQSRELVFDKFYRANAITDPQSQRPPGIGMGLAIAKGIVEAHGGRIWIEDGSAGNGTRVVCDLPVGDEDETTKKSEPSAKRLGHES